MDKVIKVIVAIIKVIVVIVLADAILLISLLAFPEMWLWFLDCMEILF